MKNNQYIMYITVALLLIIASLSYVQNFASSILGLDKPSLYSNLYVAIGLFLIYLLVKYLIKEYVKEDFFFQVTSDHKCTGAFKGKPNQFQYDNFYDLNKCKEKNEQNLVSAGYGFITNNPTNEAINPDPEKANPYFGGQLPRNSGEF
jgi:hypothetical protein